MLCATIARRRDPVLTQPFRESGAGLLDPEFSPVIAACEK